MPRFKAIHRKRNIARLFIAASPGGDGGPPLPFRGIGLRSAWRSLGSAAKRPNGYRGANERSAQTAAAGGIAVTFLVECIAKTLQTKRIPLHLALIAASKYCAMSRTAANAVAFVDAPIP